MMDDAIIALQIILCSCGNVSPLGNTYIVLKASSYFDVRHMSANTYIVLKASSHFVMKEIHMSANTYIVLKASSHFSGIHVGLYMLYREEKKQHRCLATVPLHWTTDCKQEPGSSFSSRRSTAKTVQMRSSQHGERMQSYACPGAFTGNTARKCGR